MKCINCGNENKDNTNFCSNCGVKLEQQIQQEPAQNGNIDIKQIQNTNNKKIPTLSWVASGFLCMQLLCFGGLYVDIMVYESKLLFIFAFPYVIVSLILAIISRVRNKDKMSLALIIVDAVIIIIAICLLVIFVIALGKMFSSCFEPESGYWDLFSEFVESVGRATQ